MGQAKICEYPQGINNLEKCLDDPVRRKWDSAIRELGNYATLQNALTTFFSNLYTVLASMMSMHEGMPLPPCNKPAIHGKRGNAGHN